MKLDYLKNNHPKNKKEIISVGLLGVSAFMGILIVIKVTAFFAAPARAENSVKRAVTLSRPDANEVKKHLAKSKAIADVLKRKNLFAPPPPKQQPVKQVLGILGSEALINGKWYKVGDTIGDAKIVAIEPTRIKIDWDGREIVLAPLEAASSSGSGPPRRAGPVATSGGGGRPEMVVVRPEGRPMPGRRDGDLSPEERARRGGFEGMRERLQNMSPEERERARAEMRARFENMSEQERERFRAQMRERFGGRGRPGGERGPGGGRGSSSRRGPGGRR